MKDNFPAYSMKVVFKPLSGKRVKYRVWAKWNKFYWAAQGANGEEDTLEAAMRSAREWILLGVNGLKSHSDYHGVLTHAS
jgi:hypothetical protein